MGVGWEFGRGIMLLFNGALGPDHSGGAKSCEHTSFWPIYGSMELA